MSVLSEMTNLMDAGRRIYGGTGKMSITELAKHLSSAYSSNVIVAHSKDELLKYQANFVSIAPNDDGYVTVTLGTISDGVGDDRLFTSLSQSISDDMTAILIARRNPSTASEKVPLQVGAYDNLVSIDVSSSDWQAYVVPLKQSISSTLSIYLRGAENDAIDLKDVILVRPVGGVTPANLIDPDKTARISCEESQGLFSFDATGHTFGKDEYLDFIAYYGMHLDQSSSYRLSFAARGQGTVNTYVYGNNKWGGYADNDHAWKLTNDWQSYTQTITPGGVPSPGSFVFRARGQAKGELADLQLIKIS